MSLLRKSQKLTHISFDRTYWAGESTPVFAPNITAIGKIHTPQFKKSLLPWLSNITTIYIIHIVANNVFFEILINNTIAVTDNAPPADDGDPKKYSKFHIVVLPPSQNCDWASNVLYTLL